MPSPITQVDGFTVADANLIDSMGIDPTFVEPIAADNTITTKQEWDEIICHKY